MTILDFLLLAFATHQVINVLRYSSLFASFRDWQEMGCHLLNSRGSFHKLRELLGCPWCMSVHISFWLRLFYFLPQFIHTDREISFVWLLAELFRAIVESLAISQFANLIHHITKHKGPKLGT